MKTLGPLSPLAAPLSVAFSLLLCAGNLPAAGPAVAGTVGVANGAATTGGVTSGGARGGGVAPGNVAHPMTAPTTAGVRPGVSFSNNASLPNTGAIQRSPVGRAYAPAAYAPGLRTAPPVTRPAERVPSRPSNAWSGTAVSTTARNDPSRSPGRPSGYANNRPTGQHLDPGANGANLPTSNRWSSGERRHNGRNRYIYPYYSPYAYGPIYAPYIGYYGGYYGAYPYGADGVSSNVAEIPDMGSASVAPLYADQGRDASADQQNPAPQPAARNRSTDADAPRTVPENGPDSLVEAVQEELVRRGYFAGKVNAMFGTDTKDALRKFQQDRHLADSGLINEATLHALQLD